MTPTKQSWVDTKYEPINYTRVVSWKKNQKEFSCPEYKRLMKLEEPNQPPLLPTPGLEPCSMCAHPECPFHQKLIC